MKELKEVSFGWCVSNGIPMTGRACLTVDDSMVNPGFESEMTIVDLAQTMTDLLREKKPGKLSLLLEPNELMKLSKNKDVQDLFTKLLKGENPVEDDEYFEIGISFP